MECDTIFDKFFIAIGTAVVGTYDRIFSLNVPAKEKNRIDRYFDEYRKRENEEQLLKQIMLKEDAEAKKNLINNLRKIVINKISLKIILILALSILVCGMLFGAEISVILFVMIGGALFVIMKYPSLLNSRKYNDLNLELPYALRHMSTELKSGKGLYDTLITISNSNYGSLSEEFARVLEEIKYGSSNEKSLLDMADRVKSDGLTRSVQQIIGTLRVGGNLAHSLNIIAEDISFDMQIKLKEYSQKLNGFILIYTFIAILGPVLLLIMLMAASTVMGDIVPSSLIMVLYVFFFPMVVVFLGLLIRKLEPKI